jgi:hypothetical protein
VAAPAPEKGYSYDHGVGPDYLFHGMSLFGDAKKRMNYEAT